MTRFYTRKADGNQAEVVAALRAAGKSVHALHRVGQGFPDLLVADEELTALCEVKQPGERLTPDEREFFEHWRGHKFIATSGQDAVNKFAALKYLPQGLR